MKKTIKVELDDRTIEVCKLPLGKYAELLNAVKELPKTLQSLNGAENSQILAKLPTLVASNIPDAIRILMIATDLKEEELKAMGLDEVTRILVAVVEVNNYYEVYENLKKLTARPATVIEGTETETAG